MKVSFVPDSSEKKRSSAPDVEWLSLLLLFLRNDRGGEKSSEKGKAQEMLKNTELTPNPCPRRYRKRENHRQPADMQKDAVWGQDQARRNSKARLSKLEDQE